MKLKRYLQTACYLMGIGAGIACMPPAARADQVTGISSQSQANRLSLFHDYSLDSVGFNTTDVPGSIGSNSLTSLMDHWQSTDAMGSRSYEITASPFIGYDSNPEARRFGQGSVFGGADITAAYNWNIGDYDPTLGSPTEFRVAYDATGAVYDGSVNAADTFQTTLSGLYRRSLFKDSVFVEMAGADQFTTEHGSAFLNTVDLTPSVEWLFFTQASVEANYNFTNLGYYSHFEPKRNPDANRSTANLKLHLYPTPQVRGPIPDSPDVLGDILRQTLTRATIGYGAVFNETAGSDYHYESNRVYMGLEGLRYPNRNGITFDVTYGHEWQNYMSPNSEGPLVLIGRPGAIRRKDHVDVFTLRGNGKLLDLPRDAGTLTAFAQWDLIADRSNIEVRHFNEYVISGGITYRF